MAKTNRSTARPKPAKVTAIAKRPASGKAEAPLDPTLAFMERIAKDRTIDVGKLERLIELQKDILGIQAKAAFGAAFAAMQAPGELPAISKRGKILDKQKNVRSRYARLEDIHEAIKPVLQRHGFALRHRTEWPREGIIRVVGILSHIQGHSEESAFEAPMDKSEYRTDIQSMGSTVSYGRRYTTIDLLNLTQKGVDDDGQAAERQAPKPSAPAGTNVDDDKPITDTQHQKLLRAIARSNRERAEVAVWLSARFNVKSSAGLLRRDFEFACTAIEHPGPLPLDREAGSEG